MDSATPPIPLPSVAWSHLAASQGEMAPSEAASPLTPPTGSAQEAAEALRARLLRMIVAKEHSRKTASAEVFNAR
jgi:hypothetical protein